MSEVEVFFTEKLESAGSGGKLNRKRKQQSKRTEKFGDYEVLEPCVSVVLVDNGKHGIFGPISQDIDEIP